MPESPRRFNLADLLLLALVLAVAAGARVGYLLACADGGRGPGPLRVEETPPAEGRDALVRNLRTRGAFVGPAPFAATEQDTAHTSPGYPWMLALLGRVVDPASVDRIVRWIQAGLGSLTAVFYFLFARRAFRSPAGATLAGLFAALHPFWIIDTAAIESGVLTAFLLGLALFLGVRAAQTAGPLTSLLYGLVLAGLALVRAPLLPFAFVAIAWFLLRSRSLARGWLCAFVSFLGFVIGLAPWTVRNLQVFGEPLPVVDSAYYHLWVGNNPLATGGPATGEMLHAAPEAELAPVKSEPQRYARLGGLVWHEVRGNPARAWYLRLRAGLAFFLGERWLDEGGKLAEPNGSPGEGMPTWLANSYGAILQGTLLLVFLLSLLGWRWTYAWRFEARPLALAMVWVPLPYLLSHAGALSGPRLPLDGVLLCYTAFALVCLVPGQARRLLGGPRVEEVVERPA